MLILPIVNKRRVMNVRVKLKDARQVRKGVSYDDAKESEIIVNRERYSKSSFKDSHSDKSPMDFIRSRSMLYPRNYLVTTKTRPSDPVYDVYEVTPPPKKVNDSLDGLYGKAITDIRKRIPGRENRGRYVSLEKLGIGKHLTDDKIASLQRIVKEERNEETWPRLFAEAGVSDLSETVDFMNHFECTVLSDTTIPEDSLQDTLTALSNIQTRDYKNLKNYYQMAKSNTEIYTKISYIHKLLYDKPMPLIQSKDQDAKKLVKKKEETDY